VTPMRKDGGASGREARENRGHKPERQGGGRGKPTRETQQAAVSESAMGAALREAFRKNRSCWALRGGG